VLNVASKEIELLCPNFVIISACQRVWMPDVNGVSSWLGKFKSIGA